MATKSRPILFNGPMVRAILDGRKTQTRRVVKPQPTNVECLHVGGGVEWPCSPTPEGCMQAMHCPFGQPGDRLWVRETWMPVGTHPDPGSNTGRCFYRADYFEHEWADLARDAGRRWRPSIHMPRWASRITLEVVSVRVERLGDITDADAIAEGYANAEAFLSGDWAAPLRDDNPWVWVVEFKLVEGAAA